MKHLATLKFIDAIARAGSIRRAAEAMAITPSALNRRLLAVEEELDTLLFERFATGVRPSAAGELFLNHARRQVADMARIQSQIEDMKGARRGHVVFGFDNTLTMQGFSEEIGEYQKNFPEVTFSVQRIDRNAAQDLLSSYEIDLAGVMQPESFPGISTLAVAPLSVKAVVHPLHPLAGAGAVSLSELIDYPLVLPPSGSLRDLLDSAASRKGWELQPMLECELPLAGPCLEHTFAIGFCANMAGRSEVGIADMIGIPIREIDLPIHNLHLLQLRGRTLSVAASRYADGIAQSFARYADEID